MWFNVASLNGNQEAYEQRSAIAAIMPPAAIEEAQGMAVKCISNFIQGLWTDNLQVKKRWCL